MSGERRLDGPVCLIADTTDFAGAEFYMVVLVERLRGRCDFVALLGDEASEETGRRLEQVGARVRTVPGLRRRPGPRVIPRLLRAIDSVNPSVVQVNLSDQGDNIAALLAAGRSGRPSVATLNLVLPQRARWREEISRIVLRRVDKVIAVSDSVDRYLQRRKIGSAVVKYGLPPPEPAAEARALLGVDTSDFVVGGIGRLHEQKGWDVFCRAAELLRETIPQARFLVIGDGPERDALTALPECGAVHFLGRRSSAAALMVGFDIMVIPSRYEGLGLTAVEALFLGVPVIASNVAGLAEALGDCAVLVPPDDPAALGEAIAALASDPGRRSALAARGRARAKDQFSVERMAGETLEVYESVLRPGG